MAEGVRNVPEMSRHLNHYVTHELFQGRSVPDKENRRFFPTKRAIRSHMYAASVRQQFSFIDQENVEATVEQWSSKNPQDRFFFRPHSFTKEADATGDANHLPEDDDNQKDDDVSVSFGLEDTTLGPIFMFSVQKGEFVQVLHDGNIHWVCISNIGCKENEINYYDSLRGGRVSWYLLQQIASIVHENGPQLVINPMKVQKQNNGVVCGLYALAFATSLVNGISPEDETFSVEELRPHLLKCLQEGKMKPFPRESEITHKRVRPTTTIKLNLYCHCRMPWRPSDKEVRGMAMAECEICLKWFHQKCENIPDSIFRDGGSWTCNDCTARNWTTMAFQTHSPDLTSLKSIARASSVIYRAL